MSAERYGGADYFTKVVRELILALPPVTPAIRRSPPLQCRSSAAPSTIPASPNSGVTMPYVSLSLLQSLAIALLLATPLAAQQPDTGAAALLRPAPWLRCEATAAGHAQPLLNRAWLAAGADRFRGRVIHYKDLSLLNQNYQSDRSYAPFLMFYIQREAWFDPSTGVERARGTTTAPGADFAGPVMLTTAHATWAVRDTATLPLAAAHSASLTTRPLNVLAVLHDWRNSESVVTAGRCTYRDYPRIALVRRGAYGAETLLLDPRNYLPVGLIREEPHYLWGQIRVEYLWTNWQTTDGIVTPGGAVRMVDGDADINRTIAAARVLPADSAPTLAVPDTNLRHAAALPSFLQALPPDTVRVGANTFLLVNRGYTQAVTLQRDTVFVLDATQSEARARQDSSWIARLFPGRHPVALVVTDLAWPHIGGLRFWVANGATVISHRASRAFLERAVAQRWTRTPDLLERRRAARTRLRFRAVEDSLALAAGALVLHPIDGISSEGALIAWVPSERFLWAGDYIQNLREPTQYTNEVWLATRRARIHPERTAAQHVPLTDWRVVDGLVGDLAREAQTVEAGDSIVRGDLLPLEQTTFRLRTVAGGEQRDGGGYAQQTARITYRGKPALLKVVTVETPRGVLVDSAIVEARTLQPLWHSSHSPVQVMTLHFTGTQVRGTLTPAGKATETIAHDFTAHAFDSNVLELVVAALPLVEGYSARVPFYIFEHGGLVWRTVRVTGADAAALAVQVDGDGQVIRYRIDRQSRRVLSAEFDLGPGRTMVLAP